MAFRKLKFIFIFLKIFFIKCTSLYDFFFKKKKTVGKTYMACAGLSVIEQKIDIKN